MGRQQQWPETETGKHRDDAEQRYDSPAERRKQLDRDDQRSADQSERAACHIHLDGAEGAELRPDQCGNGR